MTRLGPYLLGPNAENQGVYTGDALECLRQVPGHSLDAIIADPPYCSGAITEAGRSRANGQGLRSETRKSFKWFPGDNMGTSGLAWLLRLLAVEAMRVLKETGSLLVFCDWRMLPMIEPAMESSGLRYQALVVWDKGNMGLGTGFRARHELILHFTCGSPEYHDQSTGNVIQAQRVQSRDKYHPTEKPTTLLASLIRVVTPKGGAVCDPFCGSASTLVAAVREGRRAIGFEIDPDIAERARERIRNTQPPLPGLVLPQQKEMGFP